ncbi:Rieske 2Fe-2S domain-containing protein [Janthinobacterium sp. UMAB-56]|uniref:Rieske (2Fe-2S) protein n=1 Tax=Janthinobacterium sp. UMAB-56 TaxID=1365361 RepID=UPI00214B2F5F|nr:Rieske 2Fe-2S domain-containing protein [Janthinobacterium sp. UMAB-56]
MSGIKQANLAGAAFLCRAEELAEGQSRGFDPWHEGHDTVLLVRHQGRVHGWRDACPHHGGTPMAWRKDAYLNADRSRIVCAAHGAQFDIASGVCTLGPCMGQSLQRVDIVTTTQQEIFIQREHGGDRENDKHG